MKRKWYYLVELVGILALVWNIWGPVADPWFSEQTPSDKVFMFLIGAGVIFAVAGIIRAYVRLGRRYR